MENLTASQFVTLAFKGWSTGFFLGMLVWLVRTIARRVNSYIGSAMKVGLT